MTDEEAAKILRVARDCADGYRRNIADEPENAQWLERCACAASNVGWFILSSFGYSSDEIRRLVRDVPDMGAPPAAYPSP